MKSFVLPVDKPAGPTSHDIVAMARRALKTRRIGHTGTLDPFASGLLLLCVEQATRIAEYLMDLPKTYLATARFDGVSTTDDITGEITRSNGAIDEAAVRAALQAHVGTILQRPSSYSAKKIAGERAYDLARRGAAPDLAPVPVTIHALDIHAVDLPEVRFEVTCSSGTYVRAIARDAGAALGSGGYLSALRRTAIGAINVARAVSPERLADGERIAPLDALTNLPKVVVDAAEERALRFGQAIERAAPVGIVAVVSNHELLAIGVSDGTRMRPRKVLAV